MYHVFIIIRECHVRFCNYTALRAFTNMRKFLYNFVKLIIVFAADSAPVNFLSHFRRMPCDESFRNFNFVTVVIRARRVCHHVRIVCIIYQNYKLLSFEITTIRTIGTLPCTETRTTCTFPHVARSLYEFFANATRMIDMRVIINTTFARNTYFRTYLRDFSRHHRSNLFSVASSITC